MLEASAQSDELVILTMAELDALYHTLLQAERPPTASMTDLPGF